MNLLESTMKQIVPHDADSRARAHTRLEQLTMPYWALGRLMDLAEELAGMTGSIKPPVSRKTVVTMAGDHGIIAAGVSKYPQEVTVQMIYNFINGGAGINALARLVGAKVVVVDMGVAGDLSELANAGKIISKRAGAGTKNMVAGPAMSRDEAIRALEGGIEVAQELGSSTTSSNRRYGIGEYISQRKRLSTYSAVSFLNSGRGRASTDEQLILKSQ